MAVERTLSIIKPDATRRNLTGKIIAKFEDAGLRVIASRRLRLSQADAEAFYGVHRERPFFKDLVKFMISGPVVVQVLEGEGAIAKNREVMGATNPANAAAGTIRKEFAESIEANSVHGSDAPETAANEIKFFFRDLDIVRVSRDSKRPSHCGGLFDHERRSRRAGATRVAGIECAVRAAAIRRGAMTEPFS